MRSDIELHSACLKCGGKVNNQGFPEVPRRWCIPCIGIIRSSEDKFWNDLIPQEVRVAKKYLNRQMYSGATLGRVEYEGRVPWF